MTKIFFCKKKLTVGLMIYKNNYQYINNKYCTP